MRGRKGQVALEDLAVTAFVLVIVAIIAGVAFVNYDQSVKVAKANDSLTLMVNAADDLYGRGKGNAGFIEVSFPLGMTELDIDDVCCTPNLATCTTRTQVENEAACNVADEKVEASIIKMQVSLIGGSTTIQRTSKAKLELQGFSEETQKIAGSPPFTVRVSWEHPDLPWQQTDRILFTCTNCPE